MTTIIEGVVVAWAKRQREESLDLTRRIERAKSLCMPPIEAAPSVTKRPN